jgi:hypothetical protein
MISSLGRISVLLSGSVPGLLLALAAKPFVLGEGALFLGLLFAFLGPLFVCAAKISLAPAEKPCAEEEGGQHRLRAEQDDETTRCAGGRGVEE